MRTKSVVVANRELAEMVVLFWDEPMFVVGTGRIDCWGGRALC